VEFSRAALRSSDKAVVEKYSAISVGEDWDVS
jgi:hypothetical protein